MLVHPDHQTIQLAFVGAWVALMVFGSFYSLALSPKTKEKLRPCMSVLVGAGFLGFVFLLYGVTTFALAAIPVTIIAFLNCRAVKQCPDCVSLNRSPVVFPAPKACPKCGNDMVTAAIRA